MSTYQHQGAVQALLDEYQRAINELKELIAGFTTAQLVKLVDPHTLDQNCKSFQRILSHVVSAGNNYVVYIRQSLGEDTMPSPKVIHQNSIAYQADLDQLMINTRQLFKDYPKLDIESYDPAKKIIVPWGQRYDVEQLMEHAIVHILRHRRQIERLMEKL